MNDELVITLNQLKDMAKRLAVQYAELTIAVAEEIEDLTATVQELQDELNTLQSETTGYTIDRGCVVSSTVEAYAVEVPLCGEDYCGALA